MRTKRIVYFDENLVRPAQFQHTMAFDLSKHNFVPKHIKLSDSEKNKLLEKHGIDLKSLPKILLRDSALAHLNTKEGDLIEIQRQSKTAGKIAYYRVVVHG